MLPEDKFHRIHRSHIVNVNHITLIEGCEVYLNHKTILNIGANNDDNLLLEKINYLSFKRLKSENNEQ